MQTVIFYDMQSPSHLTIRFGFPPPERQRAIRHFRREIELKHLECPTIQPKPDNPKVQKVQTVISGRANLLFLKTTSLIFCIKSQSTFYYMYKVI